MQQNGFLAAWLRDLGSAVGLLLGIFAMFKVFFEGRPFSYVEPDKVDGILKLYVLNTSKRSIVINSSLLFPEQRWYIAPNAANLTAAGLQHSRYGTPETAGKNRRSHNVIIGPEQKHEFFLGLADRDANPTYCFIFITWQPLGGLPVPRPPLLLYRNQTQIKSLFRARKGNQDTSV